MRHHWRMCHGLATPDLIYDSLPDTPLPNEADNRPPAAKTSLRQQPAAFTSEAADVTYIQQAT